MTEHEHDEVVMLETPMIDVWYDSTEFLPPHGIRVLTYSADYKGVDNSMVFRLMGGEFVKISKEAGFWKIPSEPGPTT